MPDGADNVAMRLDRPRQVTLVMAGGAAVAGAAGSMLGPWWAVAGVLVGPCIALTLAAILETLTTTDPALLPVDQHREALRLIDRTMASNQVLARIWPSQFQDALADRLLTFHRQFAAAAGLAH